MEVIIDTSSEKIITPKRYVATEPVTPESDTLDADLRKQAKHGSPLEFDRMLLEDRANPAATDSWGYNALFEAIGDKNISKVMTLVHRKDSKTFINSKTQGTNGEKITPLFCALFEINPTPETLKITRLLLEHGAEVDQELLSRMGAPGYNSVNDERNMIVRAYDLVNRLSDNTYTSILTTLWKEGKERLSKPKLDALLHYDDDKKGCHTPEEHQLLKAFTRDFAGILSAVRPVEGYKERIVPGGRY